jgi:copper(I)-binding protein
MEEMMRLKITLAIAFALSVAFALMAHAHDYKTSTLHIEHPWTRVTPKGATVAGGYVKIENKGMAADRLIGASAEVSGRTELHEMKMEGTVMRMRALANGIEIPASGNVELKPGGLHIMFLELKVPLEQGKHFKGTLLFEKAGTVAVEFAVEGMDSAGGHGGSHKGH